MSDEQGPVSKRRKLQEVFGSFNGISGSIQQAHLDRDRIPQRVQESDSRIDTSLVSDWNDEAAHRGTGRYAGDSNPRDLEANGASKPLVGADHSGADGGFGARCQNADLA